MDTKRAIVQLKKLLSRILIVVTIIIWLLLMKIMNPESIALFSAAISFTLGNTIKNVFEAVVFVFVVHPFDVGDCCVVDGVPLMVEEIRVLSTVFLKLDKERIYYPNSILATKTISNYSRSPNMGEFVEFSIDFATPENKIEKAEKLIKEYIAKKPKIWQRDNAAVVVKESSEESDKNKLKMTFHCQYTSNFQHFGEKYQRRTKLVFAIKKILKDLKINFKGEDC